MIFTERTIMVVNDSATINKPLILYRGDKNIELKITIAESQFKFRNNDASNVIETTDASYAQLVINTPYNSPIFSEVAATKNGTVIFVISEAMIDEIREVGIYDIQIRLLDDDKQSRVTIPPVSNAIEIREPMAIEDGSVVDSNVVNVAKVNRALTTTSAPLEVFDSQGNYIKKIWGDGDPITDAALNKLEAGIDGVNKKVALKVDLSGYQEKVEGKGLSTNDYTTEEKNKLASLPLNYELSEKSVMQNHLGFLVSNGNLISKDRLIVDSYINNSGAVLSSAKYAIFEDFIEASDSLPCYIHLRKSVYYGIAYYDSNKKFISNRKFKTDPKGSYLIDLVENASYIRLSVYDYTTCVDDIAVSRSEKFNNWCDTIPNDMLDRDYLQSIEPNNIADNTVSNSKIKNNTIEINKFAFINKGNNLIDISKYQFDKTISGGDNKAIVNANNYAVSDIIPISQENIDNYYIQSIRSEFYAMIYYYASDNSFISNQKFNGGKLIIPENTNYLRVVLYNPTKLYDKVYLTVGNNIAPATILEHYYDYESLKTHLFRTWYYKKKVTAFGDSITAQATWLPGVTSYFGLDRMTNCGIGGTTVANNGATDESGNQLWMCSDYRISTIPSDSDVILVFGGHNDWGTEAITIGEVGVTPFDDTTFIGAYSILIKKLITNFPNARIIAMTPVGGRTNLNENQDTQMELYGRCMTDMANAVKQVCAYFGIPCIDVNAESGINTLNHTTYINDLIHPNANGGKLIANCVINGMKRFEPIDL